MLTDELQRLVFDIRPNSAGKSPEERARLLDKPAFGRVATDHMVMIAWNAERGWHDARVEARRPLSIDPACAVLHYAQEIFEGLKAYRTEDGRIVMFRPFENAKRFHASAERMAMAPLPEDVFVRALEELIRIDADWIPEGESGSLYLRPFMFGSEAFLGVRPSGEYLFMVIASPVGPYFSSGREAISVWVSDLYSRAAAGGTGAAKCGGNYAAGLIAQTDAASHGCDQVVFLDAAEHRWIEELGGMNIFFVFDDGTIRTPPLGGTILPGITRSSIITLAREGGLTVEEAPYAIDEWRADAASGRLTEAFVCGTAAVLVPIGEVRSAQGDFTVGSGGMGQTAKRFKDDLVGIQRGRIADSHDWVYPVTV